MSKRKKFQFGSMSKTQREQVLKPVVKATNLKKNI